MPGFSSSGRLATVGLLVTLGAMVAPGGATEEDGRVRAVVESDAFRERYDDYRQRTEGRGIDSLNAYLDSAVEDLLLDASRVSSSGLSAEVRHFGDALVDGLRAELCDRPSAELPEGRELEITIVRGLARAADASSLRASPGSYGRMGGIVANILRLARRANLCRADRFSDLE